MHHSYASRGLDERKTPNTSVFSMSNKCFHHFVHPVTRCAPLLTVHRQLLERDHSLHFALLRLQLVELIRNCIILPVDDPKTLTAMKFAETELAPRASTNPQFLDDLERTMTLLFYEPKNLPAQYAVLLEPKLRKDVAQRVNEALLKEQGERTKAKLYDLVRLRAWSEMKAREAKKDIPEHLSLGLEGIQNGQGKEPMPSNGEGEAMVA